MDPMDPMDLMDEDDGRLTSMDRLAAESIGCLDEYGGGGDETGSGFHPVFIKSIGRFMEVVVSVQQRDPATRIDETPFSHS